VNEPEITIADVVILRAWRDGSVHAEVETVTLTDEAKGPITHANYSRGPHRQFVTVCGIKWFGQLSSWSYRHPQSITCPGCRQALLALSEK